MLVISSTVLEEPIIHIHFFLIEEQYYVKKHRCHFPSKSPGLFLMAQASRNQPSSGARGHRAVFFSAALLSGANLTVLGP